MLCRNCKHFVPNSNYVAVEQRLKKGHCNHPVLQLIDNVSGIVHLQEARVIRDNEEFCGPDAKLYVEEKNKLSIYFRGINLDVNVISKAVVFYLCICILCVIKISISK